MSRPRFSLKWMFFVTTLVALTMFMLVVKKYDYPIEMALSPNYMEFPTGEAAEQVTNETLQLAWEQGLRIEVEFITDSLPTGSSVRAFVLRISGTERRTLPEMISSPAHKLPLTQQEFYRRLGESIDAELKVRGTRVGLLSVEPGCFEAEQE